MATELTVALQENRQIESKVVNVKRARDMAASKKGLPTRGRNHDAKRSAGSPWSLSG
jgi:hypothetical protein